MTRTERRRADRCRLAIQSQSVDRSQSVSNSTHTPSKAVSAIKASSVG